MVDATGSVNSLQTRGGATDWVPSGFIAGLVTTTFLCLSPSLWHWSTIPIGLCGYLIGIDLVRWLRGSYDSMDPRGLLGCFGFHFFFLAPLLQIYWGYVPRYVTPALDWQEALGLLSLVNVVGLMIYRIGIAIPMQPSPSRVPPLDFRRFKTAALIAVAIGLTCYAWVIVRYGGISGYLSVVSDDREALTGAGPLLIVAESWPLIVFALVVACSRDQLRRRTGLLVLLLVAFVLAQFLTGGLRGSRSNTIWPALIALGMVHILVKDVRKRTLALGAIVLVVFMYLYGVYKSVGGDIVEVAHGRADVAVLAEESGRGQRAVVLEDLARAPTQALLVDRLTHEGSYPFGLGEGYAGDLTKYLPERLFPWAVKDKVDLGTSWLHGSSALEREWRSSRIYGLVGEGLLNFGWVGGILVFVPYTFLVRRSTAYYLAARDTREVGAGLVAPGLAIVLVLGLGSDLDNVAWFLMKQVIPIALIVWLARSRDGRSGPMMARGSSRGAGRPGPSGADT